MSDRQGRGLTVEATPSSDVTRCLVGKDVASLRKTGRLDVVCEGHGSFQLHQGDVIPAHSTGG